MAPLIQVLKARSISHSVCNTSQHEIMLDIIMDAFGVTPDFDFHIMTDNQSLIQIASSILNKFFIILSEIRPDIVLVQGDTSTTFVSTLTSFYCRIKVGHIEAGLRTKDKYDPFPEEMNRRLTSVIADFHFAPTNLARTNLRNEGIPDETIFITGNTVIDSLFSVLKLLQTNRIRVDENAKRIVEQKGPNARLILITAHRRESFGKPLISICTAIRVLSKQFPDDIFIFPVHLNPNVQKPVYEMLHGIPNIFLLQPVDYFTFVYLMNCSYLILTDSGGIQEEAPSLGKPVLVMRESTERPEAIEAGVARIVGTDQTTIFAETSLLLNNALEYKKMAVRTNPYGDGKSAHKIVDILLSKLA